MKWVKTASSLTICLRHVLAMVILSSNAGSGGMPRRYRGSYIK